MADIYRINYTNVAGDAIQIDIAKADGSNTIIETARGKGILSRSSISNPFVVIRQMQCTVILEASTSQDFADLFTNDERQWVISLSRAGNTEFQGFLEPSEIIEDWVNDQWSINLTAHCGLRDLANLSYDDAGGVYEGIISLRQILFQALEKTGHSRSVYFQCLNNTGATAEDQDFAVQYRVTSPPTNTQDCWFDQTLDQKIFVDAGGDPVDCRNVIEAILAPANACIFYRRGAWYINWVMNHQNPAKAGTFRYAIYGTWDDASIIYTTINFNQEIFSQINGGPPFWANEGVSIERKPVLSISRAEFIFNEAQSEILNPELFNNGVTVDNWTLNGTYTQILDSSTIRVLDASPSNGNSGIAAMTSDWTINDFQFGSRVKLSIEWDFNDGASPINNGVFFVRVELDGNAGTNYWLDDDGKWYTTQEEVEVYAKGPPISGIFTFESQGLPDDGPIRVIIEPCMDNVLFSRWVDLSSIRIQNLSSDGARGVTYTTQRDTLTSTYTEKNQTFDTSDSSDNLLYLGNFLQSDGISLTQWGYWADSALVSTILYQLYGRDRLMFLAQIQRLFKGDVYGWIDYNALITINGIASGATAPFSSEGFIITAWEWDSERDICSLEMQEAFWYNSMINFVDFIKKYNYGEPVEPKIKG